MRFRLLWIAAAIGLATPAPGAPIDSKRIEAAERLLDAIDYDQSTRQTLDAIIAEQKKQFQQRLAQQSGTPLPKSLADQLMAEVEATMRGAFARHGPRMREGTALIYAKHFTAAELDRLAALQSDPAMVRMRTELPAITAESMALSNAMLQAELPDMKARIEKLILDYLKRNGEPKSDS